MKLTPLEIRKHEFDRSLRGYSTEDVDAFLDLVASQWEDMAEERRRLKSKVQDLESQMRHYQKVEEALQEALEQTKKNAEQQLRNAKAEAKNILQDARGEAQEIKQEAEAERAKMSNETEKLRNQRQQIVARLRGFLSSEMEILGRYADGDQLVGSPTDMENAPPIREPESESSVPSAQKRSAEQPASRQSSLKPSAASGPGSTEESSTSDEPDFSSFDFGEPFDEPEETTATTDTPAQAASDPAPATQESTSQRTADTPSPDGDDVARDDSTVPASESSLEESLTNVIEDEEFSDATEDEPGEDLDAMDDLADFFAADTLSEADRINQGEQQAKVSPANQAKENKEKEREPRETSDRSGSIPDAGAEKDRSQESSASEGPQKPTDESKIEDKKSVSAESIFGSTMQDAGQAAGPPESSQPEPSAEDDPDEEAPPTESEFAAVFSDLGADDESATGRTSPPSTEDVFGKASETGDEQAVSDTSSDESASDPLDFAAAFGEASEAAAESMGSAASEEEEQAESRTEPADTRESDAVDESMFAAAFGDESTGGEAEPDSSASADPSRMNMGSDQPSLEDASVDQVEAGDDDLERAMRSLFPVLSGGEEASSQASEPSTGAAQAATDAAAEPSSGSAPQTTPSATESGTQFDAIKQDVEDQARQKTSDTSPESASESKDAKAKKKRDDEASTEEIEKIWSILEDMD